MATPKGYARDLAGRIVPFGQTKIVREAQFQFGDALPSWLSVTSGTGGTVAHATTNPGYYLVNQASATAGQSAILATPAIPTQQYTGIYFEVFGLRWENAYTGTLAANVAVSLTNQSPDASAGARVIHRSTDPTAQIEMAGEVVANAVPFGYEMRTSGEANKHRNVGILLLPRTNEVVFTEGGIENIIAWRESPAAFLQGNVRGLIQSTTQEAVLHPFRFSGARLTLWQN